MSSIAFKTTYTVSEQVKNEQDLYRQKLKLAERKLLTEEAGFNYLPGISNLFYAPPALYYDTKRACNSLKIGDREAVRDSGLRLGQDLVAFAAATCSTLSFEDLLFKSFKDSTLLSLARYGSILGLILCFIEGVFEVVGLGRQWRFHYSQPILLARFLEKHEKTVDEQPYLFIQELRKKFPRFFPENPNSAKESNELEKKLQCAIETQSSFLRKIYAKDLQLLSFVWLTESFVKTYFNGKDAGKAIGLQRRIGVWAAKDLDERLNKFTKDLFSLSSNETESRTQEITRTFKRLDEQSLKKLFIHVLGFLAVSITGVAIALSISTGVGLIVAGSLFLVANAFSLARYLAMKGIFNHEGWEFKFSKSLPTN